MSRRPEHLPKKKDIRKACEEIRANWSDVERQKREHYLNPNPVEIPSIALSSLERQ